MDAALHFVTQYGYLGLFLLLMLGILGLPVPDEWLLLFGGFLVSRGDLGAVPTFLTALAGSACGISVSYILGRTVGLGLIHRYGARFHFGEDKVERVQHWYDRVGKWCLVGGYFVPGVRHLTAIVAGAARLRWSTFAPFAYAGACLWTATFLVTGYVVGDHWRAFALRLRAHHSLVLALAVAALGVVLLWRRWRRA